MLEHGKASSWLQAPALHNSSCSARPASGGAGAAAGGGVTLWAVTQSMLVLLLSVAILAANLTAIVVLNSRRYSKYIHAQPRYLLTSLASNDLAIGLLVTPFGVLPAVYRCWPYGEIFCQIQVLDVPLHSSHLTLQLLETIIHSHTTKKQTALPLW
ncbi:trace amine-associated receptor 1-like [Schistocerca cancellata]|uniref:trace amine-associated receptor 1-like n=1 Tax=Schistocerca cancellata TaxID=274614 RepID=UPI00211800C0|nr:trace amine-associated receptor 1-like [Schistocerca cancellata]